MQFPNDDNGDALRRLQSQGDDLSSPRDVDFTVVFADQSAAESFALRFRELSYPTFIDCTEAQEGLPWDVRIVKHMIPTYEGIAAFEDELQEIAAAYGGRNDGWGCFSQPSANA